MAGLEDLERHLADSPSGTAPGAAERDRADMAGEFPTEAVAALQDFGLHLHYIPVEHGGRLRDYGTAVALARAVAGRDLTVAIAHGKTFLGAVCVWVAGDREQAARVAGDVAAGRAVSWGLTEREHGSDLVHGDLRARPAGAADGEHIRLDGEKWLINNATRGDIVCVLARTDPAGGPRGFSLFLVDKSRQPEGAFRPLPKVATVGIRGADISGFALHGAVADPEADRVGAEGHGLETVMKSLQLTRTLCAALSLGAADHGLREAVGFARERELYGRRLAGLPAAARTLTECYADHLLNEALSLFATRSIQALPAELSVLSAAVKYLVPVRTEDLLARLRRLLGARAWLRDVNGDTLAEGAGTFQKIERDHRIVSLFDGNTVVNLNALISQFPILARTPRTEAAPNPGLRLAADLSAELPAADHRKLRLVASSRVSVLKQLAPAVAHIEALAGADPVLAPVASAARTLLGRTDALLTEIAGQPIVPPDVPAHAFVLAHRLTLCLAGAAALSLWLGSRAALTEPTEEPDGPSGRLWRDGVWLHAVLDRVLEGCGPDGTDNPRDAAEEAALDTAHDVLGHVLHEQVLTGRLTSLLPARLAGATP
ncbi:acyl-CoA dehydrogenase family protein [Streptomyces sp. ACA25]|uniref:acyl-CoA dehydrogenase family protein n=1 Tax=Streptomyces sp. ACA25 TaxID=3022596 RepID=UPI002307F900|nr:acyl-CoA dehydrogenase family protein [Streptomyces sp. ACA25]MDB1089341.1 acyl-CoA dehydrogenase family protein [Streptomyces sp. ACA25]